MPPVGTNVELRAVGGDAAAGEVAKVRGALDGITNSSHRMEDQFSHRFTHIGLRLFMGEALQATGLGAETRQVIGLLQTSIFGLSSAFGAAAGPILLAGSALVAFVAVASKVRQHAGESAENLEKLAGATIKQYESLEKQNKQMEQYLRSGAQITPLERDEYEARVRLAEATARLAQIEMTAAIPAIKARIAELEQSRQSTIKHISIVETLGNTMLTKFVPPFMLAAAAAKHFVGDASSAGQKVAEIDVEIAKQTATLKEYIRALDALRTGNSTTWGDELALLEKHRAENEKVIKAELDGIRESERQELKSADNRLNYWIKTRQAQIKQEEENQKKLIEFEKQTASQISNTFASAMAEMIVEGKNFADTMMNVIQRMTEQIIADFIRMQIEATLMRSIMGAAGGGGFGMAFGGLAAVGKTQVVSSPTLFVAGEAGPEVATFTPVGRADEGNGSSGVGQVVINLNVSALNGNDPAGTLDLLSDELRRETAASKRFVNTVAGVSSRYSGQAY